ncbi:MAG: TCR/Tet family MFS transporter [Bacteroidota bacterium]
MNTARPAALIFIFITVLVDVIGLGIIIPVIPDLIMELTGEGVSAAAKYGGWLLFIYAFMQFLCAPLVGSLSDRFGRRPVLLLSLTGFGIDYVIAGFAPTIGWLVVARLVAGITGASITTASAYIADISTPEKKAQNFGLIGAAFGLGFIIGPVIGGLLGSYGPRVPFFAAAGITLLNVLYGFFILPESLPKEKRRRFEWKRANPLGAVSQFRQVPGVGWLVGVFSLVYFASHATQSTWSYYTMFKFDWDPAQIGFSLGIVGVCFATVQGYLTRVLIPKIGEVKSVFIGLNMYVLGFLGFAFAPTSTLMLVMIAPYALSGLSGPALQSIISNQVPANQQGELQGALTSLISLTAVFGPPFMTTVFSYFSTDQAPVVFPGAAFFIAAVLALIAIYLSKRAFTGAGSMIASHQKITHEK